VTPDIDWLKTVVFVGLLVVLATVGCALLRWMAAGSAQLPRERPFARPPRLWRYSTEKGFAFSPEPEGRTLVYNAWGVDLHSWRPGDYVEFRTFPGSLEALGLRVLRGVDERRYLCQEVRSLTGIAELERS
jgi:hypothetical protein